MSTPNEQTATQPPFGEASGSASGGPCQATPREDLLRQLLDSRIPKNEREWCAAREIESLREGIAEALMHLDTNYCIDGNSMKDSDAAMALRRVWPNSELNDSKSQYPLRNTSPKPEESQ